MIPQFYVPGHGPERPSSRQTIFADGSADESFRPGVDLELSHWRPNRTPAAYKADTSTEICLNFVLNPLPGDWDLAINNHLDVDGLLSVYSLVRGARAIAHRDTLVKLSRMGDFWDWAEPPVQAIYQALTVFMYALPLGRVPLHTLYERCFERLDQWLATGVPAVPEVAQGLAALAAAEARIASGAVGRYELNPRFVHYAIPRGVPLERALHVPLFNAALSVEAWLPPQARNRRDREKVQLVSLAGPEGWYYDLWYPGYRWAETPTCWEAPGFAFSGSTNGYFYGFAPLEAAIAELQAAETGDGHWRLVKKLSPFEALPGRNYPVILSCMGPDGQLAASRQPPDRVAERLAAAFQPAG